MSKKSDRFYFDNLVEAATAGCQAAEYLRQCMEQYDLSRMPAMLEKMHGFEHGADEKKHAMTAALAKAFVTPLDREDLLLLSQTIDEIPDALEEVLQQLYVDAVPHILPQAMTFVGMVCDACGQVRELLTELPHFRHSAPLQERIVEIGHTEEKCDAFYLEMMRAIREECTDPLEVIGWRAVCMRLEICADACEHVADAVEMIVMKNT